MVDPKDSCPPGRVLGYCTNVHAGASLAETRESLERHALAVKAQVCPETPMGVGLWLSAAVARELLDERRCAELSEFLVGHGLRAYTLNGFPYGDFHQPVVKHAVYEPNWFQEERARYTRDLATILARLLGDEPEGSISTLPVAWRGGWRRDEHRQAAGHLKQVVEHLHEMEDRTGKLIHVDLEPEPGCVLERSEGLVGWYAEHLLRGGDEARIRRHVGVCHDLCHAAVMFEDHRDVFRRYRENGIRVGKVHISSAVRLDAAALGPEARREALRQLRQFSEDRYLHQTMVRTADALHFVDDLPTALDEFGGRPDLVQEWRIHFHVPIYLEQFGLLGTTRREIRDGLEAAAGTRHFEVETYAWGVLPAPLQHEVLADGIARELNWLREQVPAGFFA